MNPQSNEWDGFIAWSLVTCELSLVDCDNVNNTILQYYNTTTTPPKLKTDPQTHPSIHPPIHLSIHLSIQASKQEISTEYKTHNSSTHIHTHIYTYTKHPTPVPQISTPYPLPTYQPIPPLEISHQRSFIFHLVFSLRVCLIKRQGVRVNTEYWILNTEYWILNTEYWIQWGKWNSRG